MANKKPKVAAAEKEAAKKTEAEMLLAKKEAAEKSLHEVSQQVRPGMKIGGLVATLTGLPNTCAATGSGFAEGELWFAADEDAARSGQGFCLEHAITVAERALTAV